MNVQELLVKSLEDAEFDIYQATDVETVDAACQKALSDIHGAEVAQLFSDGQVEAWKSRIQQVVDFRRASLEWKNEQKN